MTTPELDKKVEEYLNIKFPHEYQRHTTAKALAQLDFRAGYTQCLKDHEHLQAENARISEEHNKLATEHLELLRKYDDLYSKYYSR